DQSFWLDEASQAQMSLMTVKSIWFDRQADFHPPLFYFLSHFWLQFGRSEIWLRLLPVSFGIVNILAIYYLAKALSPKVGLIAAFLLAINPFHVYYSQEFRMYSLLALLGTLSMLVFIKKKRSLILINALLLYTHYASIFLIFTQIIYCFIFDRKYLKTSILYFLLSIILFIPWLPQFLVQLQSGANIDTYLPGWRSILTLSPLKSLPLILFKFVAGRIDLLPRYVYAAYIAFVLGVTAAGLLIARGKRRLLYTWLFFPIAASLILSFFIPQTQPFRLIFTLPALVILLAESVLRFPKLFLTLLIYIAVVGNYTYFTRPRLQREQWRQAISFLRQQNITVMVKFFDKFAPFYWYGSDIKV
ncbi:MAG: glycosyltransferase family 39 protein, partial [Patescibacteria group bacterium]